ncbi:MAG: CehA/McbA family metallohydrolase, partial [Verrucomicrobiota bacterium]
MSAFYGEGNETPGCLYDLTLKDSDNDQITIFTPSTQKGPVNYVRRIEGLEEGLVGVETVRTAAKGGGVSRRHEYLLAEGWQGVLILSEFENLGEKEEKLSLKDGWTQMRERGNVKGIQWADSIDPADKCGYAYAWVEEFGAELPKSDTITLRKGEKIRVARFLAVADSPAAAVGLVAQRRSPDAVRMLELTLLDSEGRGISSGRVGIKLGDAKPVFAYPNEEGTVSLFWPLGEHELSCEDMGRATQVIDLAVERGETTAKEIMLSGQSAVRFALADGKGKDTPCKIQFHARRGTAPVELGPTDRAHGCVDQWHSETGSFRVPLPPGEYRIVATRGPEYDALTIDIELPPGEEVDVSGQLIRSVETLGWVSTDFHNQSTPSGDNTCGTSDRLINLASEQIEFAPTTEHNRLYDWTPLIKELGLEKVLSTVPGMELTGRGAHFNAFPLKPDPRKQDGGAPVWQKDPRLNAIVLRGFQGEERDRWIHLNHPDMSENFIDSNRDGRPDGGYAFFGNLIDGLESQNYRGSNILAGAPFEIGRARTGLGKQVNYFREFIWLQLLNQGLTVWGLGVADAHHVYGNGVGSWRTYIPSSTDDPAQIDWREMSRNAKAGRMILTSGPYLEVETGSGIIAGGHDRVSGELELNVRVQCANWLDIDRVQVLVNGAQDERYNYTRENNAEMFGDGVVKFDHALSLNLSEDAHIIVVAIGEKATLQRGFGTSTQASIHPCAYNNPIYVDVDGGGFQ